MSMLYKSLQKLHNEERKDGHRPVVSYGYRAGSLRKRLVRAGLIVFIFIAVLAGVGKLMESRLELYVQTLREPQEGEQVADAAGQGQTAKEGEAFRAQVVHHNPQDQNESQKSEELEASGSEEMQIVTLNKGRSPKEDQEDGDGQDRVQANAQQKGRQKVTGRMKAEPDSKQHFLDERFSKRAERNRRVLTLSRSLQQAYSNDDQEAFASCLDKLRGILPETSPFVAKWEGIQALRQGETQAAIRLFRQVLVQNPEDASARANLALALLHLGQRAKARRVVQELAARDGYISLVSKLRARLDER
jgi:tetratricopeptide (TPR) repeat protein